MSSLPAKAGHSRLRTFAGIAKETAAEWSDHQATMHGAALSFYTVFSIAPLFIIILAIAGFVFGEEAARKELFAQVASLVGAKGGEAIQAIVAAADKPIAGTWATVLAVGTLLLGATGVFVQLQNSLNALWNVRVKPGRGLRNFIKVRLLSFAMILGIGFLLLVTLVINAGLAALGKFMAGVLPAQEIIWQVVNFLISFGVVTLLFAMMFKMLPDVKIKWRDVWIGAAITAVLFNAGKLLLSLYIGKGSVASAYGAAGSLVIILVWVYYSAQIVFFGAEFTRIYAMRCGSQVKAVPGAEFVVIKELQTPEHPQTSQPTQ